jgi:hypothetical protein
MESFFRRKIVIVSDVKGEGENVEESLKIYK